MTETPPEEPTAPEQHPIVDPSPTGAPIMAGEEKYEFPPAEASPPEVLELKPNTAAEATSGPDEQISPTVYVEMTKPDGTTFKAPKANVPHYEAKGFTAGAEVDTAEAPSEPTSP